MVNTFKNVLVFLFFVLCSISYAKKDYAYGEWKTLQILKTPVLKIEATFRDAEGVTPCYGDLCCQAFHVSVCEEIGKAASLISISLDLQHGLAKNSGDVDVQFVFYDKNGFILEDRNIFVDYNGAYSFNGTWTKKGYEVNGSVAKYIKVRPKSYYNYALYLVHFKKPMNSEAVGYLVGDFKCDEGYSKRDGGFCSIIPKCSKDERYNQITNTCESLKEECERYGLKVYNPRSHSCVNPKFGMVPSKKPGYFKCEDEDGFEFYRCTESVFNPGRCENSFGYVLGGEIPSWEVDKHYCVHLEKDFIEWCEKNVYYCRIRGH